MIVSRTLKTLGCFALIGTALTTTLHASEDVFQQPHKVAEFKALTKSEYEALFAANPPKVVRELVGTAGPVGLKVGSWWGEKEKEGPSFWLETTIARLPNLLGVEVGNIKISYALHRNGYNYYNKEHKQEKSDFFTKLEFDGVQLWNPKPEDIEKALKAPLKGQRSVHLLKGIAKEDLVGLGGVVELSLPVGIEEFPFTAAEINKEKTASFGAGITVTKWDGSKVSISFKGDQSQLLRTVAYKEGKPLKRKSWSRSAGGSVVSITEEYYDAPESIKIVVAKGKEEFIYPFVLGDKPTKKE